MIKLILQFCIFRYTVQECFRETVAFSKVFQDKRNDGENIETHMCSEDNCRGMCLSYFECSGYNSNGKVCVLDFGSDEPKLIAAKGWKYVQKLVIKVSYTFYSS